MSDLKKNLAQKISDKSKTVEQQRQEVCNILIEERREKSEISLCNLVDDLCLQYETLGMLKGELQMVSTVVCEDRIEDKELEFKPFF